jgi:hypothetical protein
VKPPESVCGEYIKNFIQWRESLLFKTLPEFNDIILKSIPSEKSGEWKKWKEKNSLLPVSINEEMTVDELLTELKGSEKKISKDQVILFLFLS